VLRRDGSLTQSMPPLAEHALARTAVDVLSLDGALSVRQAADLLGVTAGRVRQRLTARKLPAQLPHWPGATWSGPSAGRIAR